MRAWLLAVSLAAGCIEAFDPQVGAPLSQRCVDEDSDPGRDVSYAEVVEIFDEYCFGCHSPTGRAPIGIEVGGLDLSTYDRLRAGGVVSRSDVVIPGRPCGSILIQKIQPGAPFGARMPLNGPPFVDADEVQLLADWIAEGAPRE
jgi:hypothetical protein